MNRISTVLKVTDRETTTSALLTGDATSETLAFVLNNHREKLKSVDLLQVPHHGSNNGPISPTFFSAIHADHAFIQHGSVEEYGHPHPETLADLILAGTANIHQAITSSDFMYSDENDGIYSNTNNIKEENRSIIDKNIIIDAKDLTGEPRPDKIIRDYNLEETDEIGLNRTLGDIFSQSDMDIHLGRATKKITVREVLAQLDLTTDIGLEEASKRFHQMAENPTFIEVLDDIGPIVILPLELSIKDLANAIDQIEPRKRVKDIYEMSNVLINRTEEEEKVLTTDEEIARHLIIFESVHTDSINFDEIDLSDSPLVDSDFSTPPKDADLDQLKKHGEVTDDEIDEYRGRRIKK